MFPLSRREFLKGTALLAAAAASSELLGQDAEAAPNQNNQGAANDQLNVAVIGVRGQGLGHVRGYAGRHNCIVTHLCDVDTAVTGPAVDAAARGQGGRRPAVVQDLRRIMENRDIHVVSIATPNHWHALAAIWALQAGKDVYVEKPVSHNVSEGRRIVEVARRHNRICQTGTQIRSSTGSRQAIEFLRSGRLGRVQVARALCYKRRDTIGRTEGPQTVPNTIDYDLWCGPAPRNPLRRRRLHYDWHWIWDYGNGDLGNQGIHQMDVARWGLNKNELARSVLSVGGRLGYEDDGETPNTQICYFDYNDAKLIFEVRGLPTPAQRGAMVGNIFHCAEGYLVFPNYNSAVAYDRDGNVIQRFQGGETHFANFIGAVRSRRMQDLNADILEGHLSSALCHLGNISYRLGRQQAFRGQRDVFGNDRDANETFASMVEHLRTNRVNVNEGTFRLGRRLTVDPRTERFVSDDEANRYLTREYRRGFEVPARA
ncbi:MAG: Gfo/Idh/MocA family oxidoreductase [Gemmataceae bacterium]|nr:Gfo/Idh/MocA family oxidoreductase [Gemmataceae bacterium]